MPTPVGGGRDGGVDEEFGDGEEVELLRRFAGRPLLFEQPKMTMIRGWAGHARVGRESGFAREAHTGSQRNPPQVPRRKDRVNART